MFDAFILVQSQPGKAARAAEGVRSMDGVTDAQTVTGPYDVIARVRVADLQDIDALLVELKSLDGVLRVLASPVVPAQRAVD